MADLLEKIVSVNINRQTRVPAMRSFSEHLFAAEFDPQGTAFENRRVLIIGDPEELVAAGLGRGSAAYRAAAKQFSQSPHIPRMYAGCKEPGESWGEALAAINRADDGFWALTTCERAAAGQKEIALWSESARKMYCIETGDAAVACEGDGDIAAWIKLMNLERSFVFYHLGCAAGEGGGLSEDDPMPGAALFGGVLTFQPGSATWMFKDMSAVPTYSLDTAAFSAASGKNAMLYSQVAGVPATFWGKTGSGEYIDIIHGCDWLQARIQNLVFADLKKSAKVPFNDTGIAIVTGALRAALQEGIDIADLLDGYEITAPDAADVAASEKAARNLPGVSFSAPVKGAVHTTRIRGNITL